MHADLILIAVRVEFYIAVEHNHDFNIHIEG
jgi:hypothetical protein